MSIAPGAIRATQLVLAVLLAADSGWLQAEDTAAAPGPRVAPAALAAASSHRWSKLTVALPADRERFPAGEGADAANALCLACHSTDMVLLQPARTQSEWETTINKMRAAYGAPVSPEQVAVLAAYLARLTDPKAM